MSFHNETPLPSLQALGARLNCESLQVEVLTRVLRHLVRKSQKKEVEGKMAKTNPEGDVAAFNLS